MQSHLLNGPHFLRTFTSVHVYFSHMSCFCWSLCFPAKRDWSVWFCCCLEAFLGFLTGPDLKLSMEMLVIENQVSFYIISFVTNKSWQNTLIEILWEIFFQQNVKISFAISSIFMPTSSLAELSVVTLSCQISYLWPDCPRKWDLCHCAMLACYIHVSLYPSVQFQSSWQLSTRSDIKTQV